MIEIRTSFLTKLSICESILGSISSIHCVVLGELVLEYAEYVDEKAEVYLIIWRNIFLNVKNSNLFEKEQTNK